MSHRYRMHVFCDECATPHPGPIVINRDELLAPDQSVGDIYDGTDLPPGIARMIDNEFQCPNKIRPYDDSFPLLT